MRLPAAGPDRAAARAAARPGFPLSALAAELRDSASRLDALDAGDPTASVRAVFSWSYQQLSTDAARMFRLLGLHPGPDITVPAAASLAATDQPMARRQLGELARAHLIAEGVPGRYAFHDLLRAYAAAEASHRDSENERDAAIARLLDHYLHTASAAALLLQPLRDPIAMAPLSSGVVLESLADHQQAVAWFEAEHYALSAAVIRAAASGFDRHAWQLPWAMADYLERRGHWHEKVSILSTGLAAAARLGDTAGQAVSYLFLAIAYVKVRHDGEAVAHVRHALELCRRLGDLRGEGKAYMVLGFMAEGQGRYADGIGHFEQSLQLFQAVGHRAGEAQMLNNIGWCYDLLGDYRQARVFSQRSLALSVELSLRHNEGHALDTLGYAEYHLGNLAEAAACCERAAGIHREFGDRPNEADTLTHLGDARYAAGELAQARSAWQEALAIFDDLDHPNAGKVRDKLAGIGGPEPA